MKSIFCSLIILSLLFHKTHAQCGTTNIALGKTVIASSEDASHTAAMVVDGNSSTDWWPSGGSGGPADQYLTVDLGANYIVCSVAVNFFDATHYAASYTIQTSIDNATWSTPVTITGNTSPIISHNIAANARYVKLAMTEKPNNFSTYAIRDIKIFNTTNQSPTASITSPAGNASFSVGNNITINATAADADGTISKVEFYKGAEKLGEDLVSPFTYTWNNVPAGNYALTVVATDNVAAATTSSVVNITVANDWSLTGNTGTTTGTHFLGSIDNKDLVIKTNNTERMRIGANGSIGVGTTGINDAAYKLFVEGAIRARKVKIDVDSWPDYVFDKKYLLIPLSEVEKFIAQHNHLPGVPAASEVQKTGLEVSESHATLLKKIEELTLYIIQQNKRIEELENKMKTNPKEK